MSGMEADEVRRDIRAMSFRHSTDDSTSRPIRYGLHVYFQHHAQHTHTKRPPKKANVIENMQEH